MDGTYIKIHLNGLRDSDCRTNYETCSFIVCSMYVVIHRFMIIRFTIIGRLFHFEIGNEILERREREGKLSRI